MLLAPWRGVAAALVVGLVAAPVLGQGLSSQLIGSLSGNATAAIAAPGDGTRLFVATDAGLIRIVKDGVLQPGSFLNVQSSTSVSGENGLLGLAFAPDYQTSGKFYIFLTGQIPGGGADTVQPRVLEFRVSADPDVADVSTVRPIIEMSSSGNHVGGWIGFGPDGYLYISRGDNGNSANSQNIESPNGKLLRIDPRGDDFPLEPNRNYAIPPGNPFAGATPGVDEVVAIGLRNPFRCSFDGATGDLYIADVGSATREEVNRVPAGTAWPLNFGWPCKEGFLVRTPVPTGCNPPSAIPYTDPIIDFTRAQNSCIIGGFVYRGCAVPSMEGRYFLGACTSAVIYSFDPASPVSTLTLHSTLSGPITSWGQDPQGELYFGSNSLRKVVPNPLADCNGNGRADGCDVESGMSRDMNRDSVPDECAGQCPADFDGSGAVDATDIFVYLDAWFSQNGQSGPALSADADGNGTVNATDLFVYLDAWFDGNGAVCA